MRTRTLANLRADVRDRADMPNAGFISDATLNEYINESIATLYGMLVGARGQDYYEKSASFTTVAGQSLYDFASMSPSVTDFGQLISVEITDGTLKRNLKPFMRKEHGRWSEYGIPAGYPVTIYYIPAPARLSADGDVFDGIMGWEEWVVLDATIKALGKEESDVSTWKEERAKIEKQINQLASDRDAGGPERIVDVTRQKDSYMYSGGLPRYRLQGATGVDGAGQKFQILWGPTPWF